MNAIDHYSPQSIGHGTCYICRAAKRDNDVIVDLERPIDLERGDMEVCVGCLGEAAEKFGGYLSPRKAAALKAKVEKLGADLADANARLVVAEAALDGLRHYDRFVGSE